MPLPFQGYIHMKSCLIQSLGKSVITSVVLLLVAILLGGCATFHAAFWTEDDLKNGLNALIGKNEKEAFAVLGVPTTSSQTDSDIVYAGNNTKYVWRHTEYFSGYEDCTNSENNNGMCEQKGNGEGECEIKLVVHEGKIIHAEYELKDNEAACIDYSAALYQYLRSLSKYKR